MYDRKKILLDFEIVIDTPSMQSMFFNVNKNDNFM